MASDGDAAGQTQFGPAQSRSFTPFSAALGGIYKLAPSWQVSGNLAYTERAPTFYELYANGLHVATGAYEEGNPDMNIEKGHATWTWPSVGRTVPTASRWAPSAATSPTTSRCSAPARRSTPTKARSRSTNSRGVPARLYGLELEGSWRPLDKGQTLDLDGKLDLMRATNEASGQPLPRIPPTRVTLGLNWSLGDWTARAEAVYAAAQDRVPTDDPATPAYTLVNLAASWALRVRGADGLLFLRLNNVGNELAYNATTIATVRPLAPLPGRGLMVGLRLNF